MAADNIFKEDEDTRNMLADIASLFGVKTDIVRQVWQFTIMAIMLRLVDVDESKLARFTLPYIGNVGIKNNGTIATSNGIEPDLDVFVRLSDSFKNLLIKSEGGNYGELSAYIQKNYIKPVVNTITQ